MSLTSPVLCISNDFSFLSRLLILDLLYLLSSDQSYLFDDESDNDGSESGSSGMCSFPDFSLRFDDTIGCVSGLGSDIFVPTGVESKCDIFSFVMFMSRIQRWLTHQNVLAALKDVPTNICYSQLS